jgi:hypothetical protein
VGLLAFAERDTVEAAATPPARQAVVTTVAVPMAAHLVVSCHLDFALLPGIICTCLVLLE